MNSIRQKITALIAGGMLSVSLAVSGIDIYITNQFASENAQITLNSTCEARKQELNSRIELVEQAVENIYLLSEKERPEFEKFSDRKNVDEYIEKFKKMAIEISSSTSGAMAVYYRVNPDITGSGSTGFFYVKSPETGVFEPHEITDLLQYEPDDIEHVGWYYVPVRAGKPLWMDPYFNQNIGVEMISYVIPIYDGPNLIGVAGIDIDFEQIVETACSVELYRSGGAEIICMGNKKMYSRSSGGITESDIPETLMNKVIHNENSASLLDGSSAKIPYKLSFDTLSNGMKILVYAPDSDINLQRNRMVLRGGIITLISLSVCLFFTLRMTGKIIKPLKDITDATKKFSEGNWNTEITCSTNDELQELTESIQVMAETTRKYITEINNMAYRDALTGVKNNTFFLRYRSELLERASAPDTEFGVVVLDVNGLKNINDSRGHEAGDALIKNSSSLICRYFSHSPVFRTGGDEFVVIMESEDYTNREKILEDFRNYIETHKKDSVELLSPSIASGMACYPEDSPEAEEIFRIADERMYKNKTEMKGGVKPR